jgi:hypothetical protein
MTFLVIYIKLRSVTNKGWIKAELQGNTPTTKGGERGAIIGMLLLYFLTATAKMVCREENFRCLTEHEAKRECLDYGYLVHFEGPSFLNVYEDGR